MEDIETAGVEQAIGRLAEHFPDIAADEIAKLVHAEHERFAGHPVRDYIPVLIEHAVRTELRERSLVIAT